LPNNIQGNLIAAEPTKLQDVVRIANNLMDQKLKGYVVKNAENKRRLEVNQRDKRGQQPPFKRPNVGGQNMERAYTAGNNERKPYNGLLPLFGDVIRDGDWVWPRVLLDKYQFLNECMVPLSNNCNTLEWRLYDGTVKRFSVAQDRVSIWDYSNVLGSTCPLCEATPRERVHEKRKTIVHY
ncbi:hypothetical protein Tco_0022635, partial [Tanacetum coccineum]